jgi:hypothetical protein
MRILTFFIGIFLVPACVVITQTAISLVRAITPLSVTGMPVSGWALVGGFAFWLLFYFTLSLPVRTYILAHELTHALWGAMMGARIFKMKISRESGSVTLSKSNFLITLAPYFFPLYTVIIIAAYYILSIFYDVEVYSPVWLALVGFTWGFHFTFTISTLLQHQTDIREYGSVFSYTIIYLINVLGICLWIVIVSSATFEQMVQFLAIHTRENACVMKEWALWIATKY